MKHPPQPSRHRIRVHYTCRQDIRAVDGRQLRRLATILLSEQLQLPRAEIGICLVEAPEITSLNEQFLGHAGPTDVITFDYSDPAPASTRRPTSTSSRPPNRHSAADRQRGSLHGEIFICMEEAVAQARRFRTRWQSELARYLIHGLLHLLGHDDAKPSDRRRMKHAEDTLLRTVARGFPLRTLARLAKLPA